MVKLSLPTLIGIKSRIQLTQPGEEEASGCVEEVVMYRCPKCCELHEWEEDAIDCCKKPNQPSKDDGANCPVCGEKHLTHRNAADCCLWKDLDATTRWKIADAVEAGAEWPVALGIASH